MACEWLIWFVSINTVLNLVDMWMLCLLFADQRRIENRYAVLLKGEPQ